jgi:hypothetical protein
MRKWTRGPETVPLDEHLRQICAHQVSETAICAVILVLQYIPGDRGTCERERERGREGGTERQRGRKRESV